MTYEEDHGRDLFGTNLFEHATKREQEEQECWWIITKGKNFPAMQNEYRFFGTKEAAKSAAESMGEGKYRKETLKHEK